MKTKPTVIEIVEQMFSSIYGKPCWSVTKGHGTNLTLNFGEPHLDVVESAADAKHPKRQITVKGQWSLWLDSCHWSISNNKVILTHSQLPEHKVAQDLQVIDGQKLKKVSLQPEYGKSTFFFEFGEVLKTSPFEERLRDGQHHCNWSFYDPKGNVLTYRADGKYSFHHMDDEAEYEWLS